MIPTKLSNLSDKWIVEAEILGETAVSLQETTRAKTLVDCSNDLTKAMIEINEAEVKVNAKRNR